MNDLLHSPLNSFREEGEMSGLDLWTDIQSRARHGEAKQKIAQGLGSDRKTVRRRLAQARPRRDQRTVPRPSLVAPYRHYIQHRVTAVDYNA
jgi:transposase